MGEKYSYLKLAEEVLRAEKKPMSPNDIWAKACQMGLDKNLITIGKTPQYTISAALGRNVRLKKSIFVCTTDNPKLYGLVDYDKREDTTVDENGLFDEYDDDIEAVQIEKNHFSLDKLRDTVVNSISLDNLINIWKYLGVTVAGYREGSKNTPRNKIVDAITDEITSLEDNRKSRKNKRYKILNDIKLYQDIEEYLELKNQNKTLFYINILYDIHKERNLDIISELFKEEEAKALQQEQTKEIVKENIDITKYTDEIEKLKKQLKESENGRKAAEKNAKEQKSKTDIEIKSLNSRIKTLNNSITEAKRNNEKLILDVEGLNSTICDNNSAISRLQEVVAKLTNLAFKRKILLLDMQRVVNDDYSDKWITITSRDALNKEMPEVDVTDLWLVRSKYTLLKRGLLIRNILDRYGHICIMEISIEQMNSMNLKEVLL